MIEVLSKESTVLSRFPVQRTALPLSPCEPSYSPDHVHQSILDEIENFLEAIALRRPGIRSQAARKQEKIFARELSLYFKSLGRNIPYRDLPGYLKRNAVVKEALIPDDEALRIAGNVTEEMNQRLNSVLRKNIESGYLLGATQAHQIFRIEPTFGLIDDGAMKWMNKRAAELVTQINETTRMDLARVLTRGSQKGESVAKLARNIRKEVSGMADISKGRAKLIANTELNEAMSEASLQTYQRLEIKGKSWSTVGDDRVAPADSANGAQGIIPIDQPFQSGHQRPPGHPGCRCSLVPERILP